MLYVVMTGRPGPGVGALIDEAEREMREVFAEPAERPEHREPAWIAVEATLNVLRDKLRRQPVAEFVEVEDEHGRGRGPISSGAVWARHPSAAGLWRLGPFERRRALP